MAKLKGNTVVSHPDGRAVSLLKGDELPAWAKDQVGEHLVDGGSDAEPTPYADQKFADLKAEIARRNNDRADEDKINPEGAASIKSYAAALEADDAAQAAKAADSSDGSGSDGDAGSGDGGSGS